MASPSMTFNVAGSVRASASLAQSGTAPYTLDYSAKMEGQVTIKNTPGSSISTLRGVRCEFLPMYGTTPIAATLPTISYDLPSTSALVPESKTFFLGTGKWSLKITNLDTGYAVTVEITDATVDGMV